MTSGDSSSKSRGPSAEALRAALWWAALLLVWGSWVWHLRTRWSYDLEFYYGWAVPALSAWLFWLRWPERPTPPRLEAGRAGLVVAMSVLCAGGLGLMHLVSTPNPLWTSASWAAYLAALGCSLGLLYLRGSYGWILHFAWSLILLGTALPWPSLVQVQFVTTLKELNAQLVGELVSLLGFPALVHGSVIELSQAYMGVEDACSGIRALQTSLMVAVFFGESLRFSLPGRVVLLLGSASIALLCNFVRTALLTWIAATQGLATSDSWHDTGGLIELGVVLFGILLLAGRMDRGGGRRLPPGTYGGPAPCRGPAFIGSLGVVLTLASGGLGTVLWYSASEHAAATQGWSLAPVGAEWRRLELASSLRERLRVDRADQYVSDQGNEGRRWIALHLRWESDPAHRYLAGLHTPDICLPNAGAKLVAKLEPLVLELSGRRLELDHLRFEAGGEAFHVFFCVWDTVRGRRLSVQENNVADFNGERWRLVWEHQSSLALEQLFFVLNRCEDDAQARQLVTQQILATLKAK